MPIQINKLVLGAVSAALLAGSAGCGSDSKGGSGGEAGRIAASLQDRQAGLSTETLEGLWFAYQEVKSEESYQNDVETGSHEDNIVSRSYVSVSEDGGYLMAYACNDPMFRVDPTTEKVFFSEEHDGFEIEISNNVRMEFDIDFDGGYEEDDETYTRSSKGTLYLFKVSDSPELPIGEIVIGEEVGDVSCISYRENHWSGKELYNGEEWSGSGVDTSFRVRGDIDLRLSRYEEDDYDDELSVMFDGERTTSWGDGASFSVKVESPLVYSFSILQEEGALEIEGSVSVF